MTSSLIGTVSPQSALTNTATLFNYAGAEGAPDHTTVDRTDDATVTVAPVTITKTRTGTNQAHTAGAQVAVGEQITYDVVVRVPEGETANFVLTDKLSSGLAIVSLNSLTPSSGESQRASAAASRRCSRTRRRPASRTSAAARRTTGAARYSASAI